MAQTFMRLYTTILNDYVRFLYKFYGQDSSISVSEVTSGGVVRIRKASSLKVSLTALHLRFVWDAFLAFDCFWLGIETKKLCRKSKNC